MVKKALAIMQDIWVRSLGQEDPQRRKWQLAPISCLENPMDGGAWRATIHGVTKSQTRLSDSAHTCRQEQGKQLPSSL